jgi:hypothetical protein
MIRTRRNISRINIVKLTHILGCHPAMRPVCAAAKLRACRAAWDNNPSIPGKRDRTFFQLDYDRSAVIRLASKQVPGLRARDVAFSKTLSEARQRACANSKWDSHFDFAVMLAHTHTAETLVIKAMLHLDQKERPAGLRAGLDRRMCRQLHQVATEMTHQPAGAAMNAVGVCRSTSAEKINPKPNKPMLPSAAPAASSAAAC